MKELNFIIITTLLAVLVWVGVEVRQISRETFVSKDLLETTRPIDGTIDTDYLSELEPANVH